MAPRKNTRREIEPSTTATLTPHAPPVTPSAMSKFIDARPVVDALAGPTKQQIRDRAYQIYLARNGRGGDAAADWLQAERELVAEARKACS